MAFEGINQMRGEEQTKKVNFHSFLKVLIVSFATSLDAFGVGIGLGVAQKPIIPFLVSIGLWHLLQLLVGFIFPEDSQKNLVQL